VFSESGATLLAVAEDLQNCSILVVKDLVVVAPCSQFRHSIPSLSAVTPLHQIIFQIVVDDADASDVEILLVLRSTRDSSSSSGSSSCDCRHSI
jgi:hypothetical protein